MSNPYIPAKRDSQTQRNRRAAHTGPTPESFRSAYAGLVARCSVWRHVFRQSCLENARLFCCLPRPRSTGCVAALPGKPREDASQTRRPVGDDRKLCLRRTCTQSRTDSEAREVLPQFRVRLPRRPLCRATEFIPRLPKYLIAVAPLLTAFENAASIFASVTDAEDSRRKMTSRPSPSAPSKSRFVLRRIANTRWFASSWPNRTQC